MGEESNRLAALLNVSTPPNPGRPAPWTPPEEDAHRPESTKDAQDAELGDGPVAAAAPGEGQAPEWPAGPAVASPAWPPPSPPPSPPPGPQPGAGAAEPPAWDPAAISGIFGRTIAAAEAQQSQLEEALAAARRQTYTAASADGEVRVTVDGRPRVVEVSVGARAVRAGAGALGAAIAEAANAAMRAAGQGTNEALLDGLDPAMRAAVEEGLAMSGRTAGRAGTGGTG
jgi:DNA-binding protein YbaB